jgi:hypothetical protein
LTPSGGPITAGRGGGKSLLGLMFVSGLLCAFRVEAQAEKIAVLSKMPKRKKSQCRKIVSLVFILFT